MSFLLIVFLQNPNVRTDKLFNASSHYLRWTGVSITLQERTRRPCAVQWRKMGGGMHRKQWTVRIGRTCTRKEPVGAPAYVFWTPYDHTGNPVWCCTFPSDFEVVLPGMHPMSTFLDWNWKDPDLASLL